MFWIKGTMMFFYKNTNVLDLKNAYFLEFCCPVLFNAINLSYMIKTI